MKILMPIAAFGLGVFVTLGQVRAHDPAVADKTASDLAASGGQVLGIGGFVGGEALRATGPVIAGGKDALQSSGIGQMLTPDTIPAASQPDPVP